MRDSMDTPGSTDPEYFDSNYEQIGSQPEIYGWFQFGFYLAAHDRINDLDFATTITQDLGL